MSRKTRGFILFLGALALLFALLLTAWNLFDADRAGKAANAVLGSLVENRTENPGPEQTLPESFRSLHSVEIDGREYVGVVEIPSLSLSLPVLRDWSYEGLKISPCRYSGSPYTNDLVICAHNYVSHFSALRWIDMGVDVYFTTVTGESFRYVTVNRETLYPTEAERMKTADGWSLTLFTCYTGGYSRCAIRCERAD